MVRGNESMCVVSACGAACGGEAFVPWHTLSMAWTLGMDTHGAHGTQAMQGTCSAWHGRPLAELLMHPSLVLPPTSLSPAFSPKPLSFQTTFFLMSAPL